MKQTTQKRKIAFLTKICSNTGECMAIGKEWKKIQDLFNGFISFDFVSSIKNIGSPNSSSNGIIKEVKYENQNYVSYAILKLNKGSCAKTDNLIYEYWVGQIINQWCSIFPCFLRTYGYYYFKKGKIIDYENLNKFKHNIQTHEDLKKLELQKEKITVNPEQWMKACQYCEFASILIENVKDSKTLTVLLKENEKNVYFVKYEILFILLQIYYPLYILIDNFTHYDLHTDNILIYTLSENKYIQFNYTFIDDNKKTQHISFKTQYIVKIIDYGRGCIKDEISQKNNTNDLIQMICDKSCFDCGKINGFHHVNRRFNSRWDLMCVFLIYQFFYEKKVHVISKVKKMVSDLGYDLSVNIGMEYPDQAKTINNVKDLFFRLIKIITSSNGNIFYPSSILSKNSESYIRYTYIGTLNIDGKNPMYFS